MAHDAKKEDYQRLSLRYARELDTSADVVSAARSFAQFGRRFARDRDSLPQSDADRAFHLVVLATDTIDYQLPFASEAKAEELIARGKDLLDEAIGLDPDCFDAIRMRSGADYPSMEGRWRFLKERADEVRARCEEARDAARAQGEGDERARLAANIAMRPWWRWLAAMAEQALICGRNHESVRLAHELLASDPADMSNARFTLAYAYAKLEDAAALEDLAAHYPSAGSSRGADDAWLWLARASLLHKLCDYDGARKCLHNILSFYRGAGAALILQSELPDGEFARLNVRPRSEDELILAVSEGVVLLQEGYERTGAGVFGSWVAREVARMDPRSAQDAAAQALRRRQVTQ